MRTATGSNTSMESDPPDVRHGRHANEPHTHVRTISMLNARGTARYQIREAPTVLYTLLLPVSHHITYVCVLNSSTRAASVGPKKRGVQKGRRTSRNKQRTKDDKSKSVQHPDVIRKTKGKNYETE